MKTVKIFENKNVGKVKPMHAVNNGPVYKFAADRGITNIEAFREAGIPYARNHDAAFHEHYGGEHIVDVHAIFPNFDADPYDENSYDFACTDEYLKVIDFAGVKTFYRLGSKIEHGVKKYSTLPPKDFKKWAIICEHIIRHYTEGWANGFKYDIEYWEIWNEADLDPDDSTNKRNWGGTAEQFYEFFNIALVHLKTKFPHLKIGGPSMARPVQYDWMKTFFERLEMKPDFFSWHRYSSDVYDVIKWMKTVKNNLNEFGYGDIESICNEWNYCCGWDEENFIKSIKAIKGLKGSSFTAGVICAGQYEPVDIMMYYDARPCRWNGMFNSDLICENLKGYYPFKMFNELYKKDCAVGVDNSEASNIYVASAKNESETSIMLTYFDNAEKEAETEVEICLEGANGERTAEIYLLDEAHDMELVETKTVSDKITLKMTLFSTVLINLK